MVLTGGDSSAAGERISLVARLAAANSVVHDH